MVPKDFELRRKIMDEAHWSRYTIHLGTNKMYQDLRKDFWWTRMKREIAKYVSECDTCRGIKAGAAWRTVTRIVAGVGDLVRRTKDDQV
jgi:hypothetical protein